MRLHYTPASPFSRKVLVLAHEGGLSDRLELVLTNVGTHVPLDTPCHTQLAKLNGLMKIPVLEIENGPALIDSRVICEYLASLCPDKHFFPADGSLRWMALRNQALADGILEAALLCRFEAIRPSVSQSKQWLESQQRRIPQALDQLEETAPDISSHMNIGDISIACALGYLCFRFEELEWRASRPQLARWFHAFSQRDSMRLTEPKVVPVNATA